MRKEEWNWTLVLNNILTVTLIILNLIQIFEAIRLML